MRIPAKTATIMLVTLALACCVTVNVYFPAPAVQEAADKIVGEVVRPGEGQPEGQAPQGQAKPGPQSALAPFSFWAWLSPRAAFAAEVNINVSTPAIRNLTSELRSRYGQLRPFLAQGAAGETNRGYVELRDTSSLDLRQRAELNRLIQATNADRTRLYGEIIKANNIGREFLPQVERLFANSWRKEAPAGAMIQTDGGSWKRK